MRVATVAICWLVAVAAYAQPSVVYPGLRVFTLPSQPDCEDGKPLLYIVRNAASTATCTESASPGVEVSCMCANGARRVADSVGAVATPLEISSAADAQVPLRILAPSTQSGNLLEIVVGSEGDGVKFGPPGMNPGSTVGAIGFPQILLKSGVDTMKLSCDNQYHCSIDSTYALTIHTTRNVSIGGPDPGVPTSMTDQNGLNFDRRSIIFGRHAGSLTGNPPVQGPVTIGIQEQWDSDFATPLHIFGNNAAHDATVEELNGNLDGGDVLIRAGGGASESVGDADGGNVTLQGGAAYGTGDDGIVNVVGGFRLTPTSAPPIACAAETEGTFYVDSESKSLCQCNGADYVLVRDGVTTAGCS